MLPFGKQEWDKLVTLLPVGAGEEDDVFFVVDRHDGKLLCGLWMGSMWTWMWIEDEERRMKGKTKGSVERRHKSHA